MGLSPAIFQNATARVDIGYKLTTSSNNQIVRLKDCIIRPGTAFEDAYLTLIITTIKAKEGGDILTIAVQPKADIELIHFEAKFSAVLTDLRMLANGFQSWSQTKELGQNDRIQDIKKSVAWYTQYNLQG